MEPEASEPLAPAVLTHDMERTVPGGPVLDKARTAWDDPEYNRCMLARIRIERAREPAARLHAQAMARLRAGAAPR